jgi:hypothetical protein
MDSAPEKTMMRTESATPSIVSGNAAIKAERNLDSRSAVRHVGILASRR